MCFGIPALQTLHNAGIKTVFCFLTDTHAKVASQINGTQMPPRVKLQSLSEFFDQALSLGLNHSKPISLTIKEFLDT